LNLPHPGHSNTQYHLARALLLQGKVAEARSAIGGFFGILADSGARYDPINLAPAFAVDGTGIRFEGHLRGDLVSFHMWGELVELAWIAADPLP
jgi:hypothetical protein